MNREPLSRPLRPTSQLMLPLLFSRPQVPGLTNALTGILAARGEGAKIILLSACTTASNRGRWAIQETDSDFLPAGLVSPGALFHMATTVRVD